MLGAPLTPSAPCLIHYCMVCLAALDWPRLKTLANPVAETVPSFANWQTTEMWAEMMDSKRPRKMVKKLKNSYKNKTKTLQGPETVSWTRVLQFCRVIQVKHLRKASVIKMIWWAALPPPPLEGSLSELFWNMEQLKLVLAQACTLKTFTKVVHVPAWYWWQYANAPCCAQSCQDSKAVSVLTAMSEVYLVTIWNCVPELELARSKWNPFLLA